MVSGFGQVGICGNSCFSADLQGFHLCAAKRAHSFSPCAPKILRKFPKKESNYFFAPFFLPSSTTSTNATAVSAPSAHCAIFSVSYHHVASRTTRVYWLMPSMPREFTTVFSTRFADVRSACATIGFAFAPSGP